ncbi:hypothetical protein SEA_DIABLA_1 [Gordonia phage Diabla]|nr:hypothetical protein SEA_DIABLA_1 [Gordonia phage Diabla]
MSRFETAGEALDYLIEMSHDRPACADNDEEIKEAAALISAEINTPAQEDMIESIQQLMRLLANGSEYFADIFTKLRVKLSLETDPTQQSILAIGSSEAAGAANALRNVVDHILSEQAGESVSLEQIFTGEGMTYPAALKRGGNKLFLPKH